jgi:hypothetical protein
VPSCQPVEVAFTGTVTSVDAPLATTAALGEPVEGCFSYDPEAPDATPTDPVYGDYPNAVTDFEVAIGAGSAITSSLPPLGISSRGADLASHHAVVPSSASPVVILGNVAEAGTAARATSDTETAAAVRGPGIGIIALHGSWRRERGLHPVRKYRHPARGSAICQQKSLSRATPAEIPGS